MSEPADPGARLREILREQGLAPPEPESHPGPVPEGGPADPVDDVIERTRDAPTEPAEDAEDAQDPPGDHAGADDEDPLPDAPLFSLLRTVEREVGIDRIDRIWVFPPRRLEVGETSVVVVSAFPEIAEDRRRVYAAHYTAPADATAPRLALDEYGTAPSERVGRLVEDVVERLKDQPASPPHAYRVDGDDQRWHAALHELAERHLEEVEKNPRLRR